MAVLVDTSFLLASLFARDANHEQAQVAVQRSQQERVIAAPVLPELFYMVAVRIHYPRAVQVFYQIQTSGFRILELTPVDRIRMHEIMTQYQDAHFDFADVAQMAIAERLEIQQILTFDRRDFSVFRPRHCEFLELLP